MALWWFQTDVNQIDCLETLAFCASTYGPTGIEAELGFECVLCPYGLFSRSLTMMLRTAAMETSDRLRDASKDALRALAATLTLSETIDALRALVSPFIG